MVYDEKLACSWTPFEWPGQRIFQILLQFRCLKTSWKFLSSIYLFKVNNRNTREMCQICSKLTIKKPDDVNDLVLMSLLLPLNIFHIIFCRFHCWLLTLKCLVGCFLIFVTKCVDKKFLMLLWLRLRVKLLSYAMSWS